MGLSPQETGIAAAQIGAALGTIPSRTLEPFIYERTLTFAEAAAVGTTRDTSFTITQDSDFVCTKIAASCRTTTLGRGVAFDADAGTEEAGGVPDLPFTLQITESGQNRVLHDQPVDAQPAYGYPHRDLPRPKVFAASTSVGISVALLKVSGAGTCGFTVRVQLHGFKDYSKASSR